MPEQNKKLTVAICTHNRSHLLGPLLERLRQTTDQSVHILIVDNSTNSKDVDEAAKLAEDFSVQIELSHPAGLSRARNKAIEVCSTELIAYLDDDAMPEKGWSRFVIDAFADERVGFVAGPIDPLWPSCGRPDWLPEKYIGCLTVLDLGDEDRALEQYEHAYGANMSFRLAAVEEAGGFDVSLGRTGTSTLLSNEETDIQGKLRQLGYIGFYASNARIGHLVESERLTRHWFLSRMAWQGASNAIMNGSPKQEELFKNLEISAKINGLSELVEKLLSPQSPEDFADRLSLVRDLSTYLLSAKSMTDNVTLSVEPKLSDTDASGSISQPSALVAHDTRILFFDGWPGHHYLYDLYSDVGRSSLVLAEGSQWENSDGEDMNFLDNCLNDSVRKIVFLTLDPYVYGNPFPFLLEFLRRTSVKTKVFGILHKLPVSPDQEARLQAVSVYLKFVVLEEGMAEEVNKGVKSASASYLPHHAVFERLLTDKSAAKRRLGLPDSKIVISILGELREGKGVDRLLESLKFLSRQVIENCIFVVCGKATNVDPVQIKGAFDESGVESRVVSSKGSDSYKLLPDPSMADYISCSGLGLILYNGIQGSCMSGVLPNYVAAGVPLLASANTTVGSVVGRYDLGWVVNVEDAMATAGAINSAVDKLIRESPPSFSKAYSTSIRSNSVIKSLQQILGLDK